MTMPNTSLPYGLRNTKVTGYTNNAATALVASSTNNANARTMSFEEAEDFEELRGDDKVIALRGKGPQVEWEMEHGGITLPAYKDMNGGTLTTTGVTPNQVTRYKKKTTDVRPYFKAEGQSISDNGGDFHVVLYKCRASGNLSGEMADGSFWLTGASGQCLPATLIGEEDTLYDFVFNESVTAIP